MPDITSNHRDTSFLARYGATILRGGISAIPSALYRYQGTIQLPPQLVWFISSILSHKWDADMPYPSLRRMAEETGVSEQQLHNYKKELVKRGWLTIINRQNAQGGKDTNFYDFTPLFIKLEELLQSEEQPHGGGHLNATLDTHLNPSLDTHLKQGLALKEPVIKETREDVNLSKIRKAKKESGDYVNPPPEVHTQVTTAETEQPRRVEPPKTQRVGSEENERPSNHRKIEEPLRTEANPPVREEVHKPKPRSSSTPGVTSVGELLLHQPLPKAVPDDEAYTAIRDFVRDMAGKNHDEASLKSSTTRAYNLYLRTGVSLGYFFNMVYEADKEANSRSTSIKKRTADGFTNRMAYFFAVLEDRLGLREKPPTASPGSS